MDIRSFLVTKYGEHVTSKLMEQDDKVYLDNNNREGEIGQEAIKSLLNSFKNLFKGINISENIWNSDKEWGVDFSSWLGDCNDKEYMFIGAEPHIENNYQLVYDFGCTKSKTEKESAIEFASGTDIWSYLSKIFIDDDDYSEETITSFLSKCYVTDLCHIVPKYCGQVKAIKNELSIKTNDWNIFRTVIAKRFLLDEIKIVNPKLIILHGNVSRMFFERHYGVKFSEPSFIKGTKYKIMKGELDGYKIIAIPHLKGMMRNFIWRSHKFPERLASAKSIINGIERDKMQIDIKSKESIEKSLESIAQDLILRKALKINNTIYTFIDIEIYYWHANHQDEYAKGVPHTKAKGELEAHRYGLDISLGNDEKTGFGGILICGLYNETEKKVIEKAHVLRTLFNELSIEGNIIQLTEHDKSSSGVFRSKRKNLGEADTSNKADFKDLKYKYLVKDSSFFAKYKGKEGIYRESDLLESEKEAMLGYHLH